MTRRSLTSVGASTPAAAAVLSRRSSTSISAARSARREPGAETGRLEVGEERGEAVLPDGAGERVDRPVDAREGGERGVELSAVDEEMLGSRRDRGAVEVDEPHVGAEHRERVRLDPVMRDAGASERVDRLPRPGEERVVDRLASPARDDRAGRVVGDEDRVAG